LTVTESGIWFETKHCQACQIAPRKPRCRWQRKDGEQTQKWLGIAD
jgi:hypothetical protein